MLFINNQKRIATRRILVQTVISGAAAAFSAGLAQAAPPYLDEHLPPARRAADLVQRLTLEEKAAQLGNDAPAVPRLGIPAYNWWNEGLHGVARAGYATVFPQAIGMAAAWDEGLMRQVGDAIATEFRAKFRGFYTPERGTRIFQGLDVWSPNINIFRDPRWGRGQETYGEDPYLTGRLGIGFIAGLQGNDVRFSKTIATAKHFAVHSGPEAKRHSESVYPTPHDLEDTYLPAFRAAVTEGKVQSVMCAYNAVDGVPACASGDLLERRLRQAWGFKGFVVSDCGAAANIYRPEALAYVKTPEEAVAKAFNAGMDLICGDYRNHMTTEAGPIVQAVRGGQLDEAVVDRALARAFEARFRLGLFDRQLPFADIRTADVDTPAHRALALRAARESMVLLKNDGLLPLKQAPATIAVIGPDADNEDALVGNYNGTPSRPVTVLAGIRTRFPQARVLYAPGASLIGAAEVPVPARHYCQDAACTAPGLAMQIHADGRLDGQASASRAVPDAAYRWADEDRNTAVRWTGYLKIDQGGEYGLRYASQTRYRVWVDEHLVVDAWKSADGAQIVPEKVALEGGKTYPIRIEADQRGMRGDQDLVWTPPGDAGQAAVDAASQADVVVFVGGLTASLEGEELGVQIPGFSRGDRTSLDLPAAQQAMLERVHAAGKPVVLVLTSGSALAVNWAAEHVPAIVQAWYPGGEGGSAVAQLIAGDYSPAGRLPVTFYRSANDLPPFEDYRMAGRTYRYFDGEPLYPFGHGLSYTRFRYAPPALSARTIRAGQTVKVSVAVTNTGAMDSDEVVQLYVAKPSGGARPTLAGFTRTHLRAGETRTVTLPLDARRLSSVDAQGKRAVVPGVYTVYAGGGQPRYVQAAGRTLTVTGPARLLPE